MSKLLRSIDSPAAAGMAFNLADLERQGEQLMERAKARAAEIIAAGQREGAKLAADAKLAGFETGRAEGLVQGREEGRKAGTEQGLAEARAATATLEKNLSALVMDIAARRETLIKQAERDLLALSVAVASRIVRRELKADSEAVVRATVEAISLAAERSRISARVNPADFEALQRAHADLMRRFADLQDFKVVADETVERGGCRLVTEAGGVDMQVGVQLSRIEQLLLGEADLDVSGETEGGK